MKTFGSMSVKERIYLILTVVFAAAICISLVVWLCSRDDDPVEVPAPPVLSEPDTITITHEVEKLVEVEKVITAQIIEDGLRDIHSLVTAEYFFTEVVDYTDVKRLFGFELPFTKSSYLVSYDGTVSAGIDCSGIHVEKNDADKQITITLPHAAVQSTTVDWDSLTVYSEKEGLGNRTSVTDYNSSLSQLEETAAKKAADRGLLTSADENAKDLIEKFILGLVGTGYETDFIYE
ncbi:MAG: DUF4230 domain-containing protein [Clostridia bacterium]|nr:DUF4230 domain-containing protein [Clostridia bacterium]